MLQNDEITARIKGLIAANKVSEYFVCKKTKIPKSSFSRMINNNSVWKIEYLILISSLFNVELEWLLYGLKNHRVNELKETIYSLKQEVMLLKDKISIYESAAKNLVDLNLKEKKQTKVKRK